MSPRYQSMTAPPKNSARIDPAARNGPNGMALLADPPRAMTTIPASGAGDEPDEHGRHNRSTQVEPHTESQLHVAHADAFGVSQALVDERCDQQKGRGAEPGQRPHPPALGVEGDHADHADRRDGKDHDVGDQAHLNVDVAHQDQRGDEEQMQGRTAVSPSITATQANSAAVSASTQRIPPVDRANRRHGNGREGRAS